MNKCPVLQTAYTGKCPNKRCVAHLPDSASGCLLQTVKYRTQISVAAHLGIKPSVRAATYTAGLRKLQLAVDLHNNLQMRPEPPKLCNRCGVINQHDCLNRAACKERRTYRKELLALFPFNAVPRSKQLFWELVADGSAAKFMVDEEYAIAVNLIRNHPSYKERVPEVSPTENENGPL